MSMDAVSHLSTGRIVGRFVYTSSGSQGWGIADEVGQVPPEVVRQALSAVERLSEPTELVVPPPSRRARRMVWGGQAGSPWRFLLHTVAAGDDASRRPHNNVTDCLVVHQSDTGAPGCEPPRLWGSTGWLTPYGSEAVSIVGLNPDESESLTMPVEDHGDPLATLAVAAASNHEPSLLYSVASLIVAIAQGSGSHPGRATVAMVEDVDFAPIFLGAAASVLPFDVAWDLPVEVRSTVFAAEPTGGSGIVAMAREAAEGLSDVDILDLGGGAPPPVPAPRGNCARCGAALESWGSLVSQCVIGLAAASAAPDADPGRIKALAESLVSVMHDASARRIGSAAVPGCFTREALAAGGHQDIADLFEAARAWELIAADHSHRPVIPMPAEPRRLAPVTLSGSSLVKDRSLRTKATVDGLLRERPSESSYWVADWLVGQDRSLARRWYVATHRALGHPGMDHIERVEAYCELYADFPEVGLGWGGRTRRPPLVEFAVDGFLTDLVTAMSDEKQRKLGLSDQLTASVIVQLAAMIRTPTWQAGLLNPRSSRFVSAWLEEKPRRGYPSGLSCELVGDDPLGYVLLSMAIAHSGDDPVPLVFLVDALQDVMGSNFRNEQFRGYSSQLWTRIHKQLTEQTIRLPAPPAGGQRA
ncbi:MAG: hypothetical protein QG597_5150 [Actinomycetota bacterium]|nr:hypothetical protein [Actinomycetota bacterium]